MNRLDASRYGRKRRVESSLVKISIDSRREKDNGRSFPWRYLDIHRWKVRLTTLGTVIKVYQNGHQPLTTVLGKSPSIFVTQVKCVKVLYIKKCEIQAERCLCN